MLRNQIVERTLCECLEVTVHSNPVVLSLSLGDVATPATISLRHSRFLQQRTTTCKAQDPQTGQEHRILGNRTHKTHAAFTRHKDTAQFPKGVFNYKEHPDGTIYLIPEQRLI